MWETIILDFDEFGEEAFEFSRFEAGDWDLDVYQDGDQWRVSAARSEVEVDLEQLTASSETAAKRAAINWLLDRISNQLKALITAHAMLFEANPAPPAVDNIPCGSCYEIQPIDQLDPCHVCSEYTCSNCLAPMFDEVDQPAGHICNRCIERVAQRLGYS